MSLLHPTPGQLVDRLTILELKVRAYQRAGKDTTALAAEWVELEPRVRALPRSELFADLYDVNERLWKAEDDIRREEPDIRRSAIVGKDIARLNDERMRLVRAIDALCGGEVVEDKVYLDTKAKGV